MILNPQKVGDFYPQNDIQISEAPQAPESLLKRWMACVLLGCHNVEGNLNKLKKPRPYRNGSNEVFGQIACGCSVECHHHAVKSLTGKPDAGEPPVRFGGRGAVNPASLPLS